MSGGGGGFLPDLASWALGGGAGGNPSNAGENTNNPSAGDNGDVSGTANMNTSDEAPLTEQEIRARRLARMEAMMSASTATPQPMEVDTTAATTSMEISPPRKSKTTGSPSTTHTSPTHEQPPLQTKKRAKESPPAAGPSVTPSNTSSTSSDPAKKLQRRKEALLKKILLISLSNGVNSGTSSIAMGDSTCVEITLDEPIPLGVHSIAEILAIRLALPPSMISTMPPQKPLLAYLAAAHRTAAEELRNLQQVRKPKEGDQEMISILEEIQKQVVSYAASSLMEPDLFEQAQDGTDQLTKALASAGVDPTQDITFGVAGPASSFYQLLCEELHSQDVEAFARVMKDVVTSLVGSLKKCDSIDSGVGDTSALSIVSALTAVCANKKVALLLATMDTFLLPAAGTPQAEETIQPPILPGADLLRMFAAENRPYKKRSGPGLEKSTILGLVLRVSTPKSNPAFPPTQILRQTLDAVERSSNQQRQQLRVYQDLCHQLIMNLIKGGAQAREQVVQWFVDCQLVNTGATAMRPDATKVSSTGLLLNVSMELLHLCDPFVSNEAKHKLIDATFVSLSEPGKLIFPTTGDDAIPRLGETDDSPMDTSTADASYAPKNTFVPQVFFLTARSLALGIVPQLSSHENLIRHISHQHWQLNSQNRDVYSDPHFSMMVSRQRSNEVALFQEEMTVATTRFINLMAKVLVGLPDELLKQMPEHFVDNMCDILMSLAKLKSKCLRGMDARYVFSLMVKLLSPSYKSLVRNYNLRAMLGDVLHEIFLPPASGDRRDIPVGLSTDPLAGGQSFLLSNELAQKTLAPSLLLLYGEVEHTGYYDKMSHRAKISSLLKYLWESTEHRPAFREITQNKESFIKFANGIINETNHLVSTVMQKLPEIRGAQEQMKNTAEWGLLNEEEQSLVTSRLEDNEREVKHALPLCNKTLQMFGYLNTDSDIRSLFLLNELCPRLVNMLVHVLGKLVGSKGLDLKVDNPEQYDFRPKEMLRDLCAIFALFASSSTFQEECAKSGCDPQMLNSAVKTCQRLNLLVGESLSAFQSLPNLVAQASRVVADDEALMEDAPDEFMDEILTTFMVDPVILPSGHYVDRSTITQHLLNDPIDPFNREEMTIDDIRPATELKARIDQWLEDKRAARGST